VNRRVLIALLLIFCSANMVQAVKFLRVGRGGYSRAIAVMMNQSPGRLVTVRTDNILRIQPVIEFYQSRLKLADRRIEIRKLSQPADWLLLSGDTPEPDRGRRPDFEFPSSDLSGFRWRLYRARDAAGEP
jgi:hypothetical protein